MNVLDVLDVLEFGQGSKGRHSSPAEQVQTRQELQME